MMTNTQTMARRRRDSALSCPARASQAAVPDPQLAMIHTYQRTGGLVSCDEVITLLRRHRDQPVSLLARWIVARTVVSFCWQSQTMVPLFQFDLADMSLRRSASDVIAELSHFLDDLGLATWFTRPNFRLGNAAPVDMLATDSAAVLRAARACRYIAAGPADE